jgi:hypothetical protein
MNWRRGFTRLWMVCTSLWLLLFIVLLSPMGNKFKAWLGPEGSDWLESTAADWPGRTSILIAPPIALLVTGLVLWWIMTSFCRSLWLFASLAWVVLCVSFFNPLSGESVRQWLPTSMTLWLEEGGRNQVGLLALMFGLPLMAAALVWVLIGFRQVAYVKCGVAQDVLADDFGQGESLQDLRSEIPTLVHSQGLRQSETDERHSPPDENRGGQATIL